MKRKKGMKKTGKNVNKTNPILINKELTILSIKFYKDRINIQKTLTSAIWRSSLVLLYLTLCHKTTQVKTPRDTDP